MQLYKSYIDSYSVRVKKKKVFFLTCNEQMKSPNNLLINQIVFHVSLSLSGQINQFCIVVLQGQNKA